jgi:hypothetical protein
MKWRFRRGWFVVGAIGVAVVASVVLSKYGPVNDGGRELLALRPGQVLLPGVLPNVQFGDRTWRIQSWNVVAAHKPLRAGGEPCDAFGGVIRDDKKDKDDVNAIFTAFGAICGGVLMHESRQPGSRVFLMPLYATPVDSNAPWTAETTLDIRFVEAVAPNESVIWTTSKQVVRTPKGIEQVLAWELAYRTSTPNPNLLVLALEKTSVDASGIQHDANKAALAAYQCGFNGDQFPKSFDCPPSTHLQWVPTLEAWK